MTETEKVIIAINAAARERGMSYGRFVSQATKAELQEAIGKHRPREKRQKK